MSNLSLDSTTQTLDNQQIDLRAVWVFCVATVVLSASPFLLLPGMIGPVMGVYIPTITAVTLIALTAGKSQVRLRLFSIRAWHISLKWLFISLGVALALRLGVSLLGLLLVPDYQWQPGPLLMALSVLVTWVYLAAGYSLSAAVLLHAGQSIFGFLNNGLDTVTTSWLMAAVYVTAALIVILLTRGRLGLPNPAAIEGRDGR